MRRYCVIVASESYTHLSPTPGCHADAELFARTLVDQTDFAEQDVILLKLTPGNSRSPVELRAELTELNKRTKPGDILVFYFAGHGHVDSGDAYLVLPTTDPMDIKGTALPLRDVSDALRDNGRFNVRFFDACHSGLDVRSGVNSAGFIRAALSDENEGWATFAGCRHDEFSHYDEKLGHGVFTKYLCDAVEQSDSGPVYLEQLKLTTCDLVARWCEENARNQRPTLNSSISGNVPLFVRLPRVAVEAKPNLAVTPDATDRVDDLLKRAASLRRFEVVGDEGQRAAVARLTDQCSASLYEARSLLDHLELEVVHQSGLLAQDIPVSLHSTIVNTVQSTGLAPLHTVRRTRIDRAANGNNPFAITAATLLGGERYRIEYTLSQSPDWPRAVASLSVTTNGVIAGGVLYAYVLPLQLRAMVLLITAKTGFSATDPSMSDIEVHTLVRDLPEDRGDPALDKAVEAVTARLGASILEASAKRLDYLEMERDYSSALTTQS